MGILPNRKLAQTKGRAILPFPERGSLSRAFFFSALAGRRPARSSTLVYFVLTDTNVAGKSMSKKKRRRVTPSNPHPSRGHVTAPSRSLADRHALRRVKAADSPLKPSPRRDLRLLEDLRNVPGPLLFDRRQAFKTTSGRKARIERKESYRDVYDPLLQQPMHDYFQDPEKVLVCIRRAARKRVLFALQKAGRGRKVSSERHFTDKSFVRCK